MCITNQKLNFLLICFSVLLSNSCFCQSSFLEIEGTWVPKNICDSTIDYSLVSLKNRKSDGFKIIRDDGIIIESNKDGTGLFGIIGLSNPWKIFSIERDENKVFLNVSAVEYQFNGSVVNEIVSKETEVIKLTLLDNDEIIFDDFSYLKDTHFYRISGPAKIPVQNAVINDNRVRLRVKPNLTCDTWALLDKGLPVKIKDKSAEPYEIDGESWYWYKVDNPNYPDGWVYGKYLDIEN